MIEGTVFAATAKGAAYDCIGVLPNVPRPSDALEWRAGTKAYLLTKDEYDDLVGTGKEADYRVGHDDGYAEGHDAGYDAGHQDGYANGRDDGYRSGYDEGYEAGQAHWEDAATRAGG
jgi:flagellar biosynthesis/type III secretory pathway protein FliH